MEAIPAIMSQRHPISWSKILSPVTSSLVRWTLHFGNFLRYIKTLFDTNFSLHFSYSKLAKFQNKAAELQNDVVELRNAVAIFQNEAADLKSEKAELENASLKQKFEIKLTEAIINKVS